MLIYDKSYSPKQLKFPDFKVSSIEYSVEDKHKITFGDDEEFFYGVKDKETIKMSRSVFNKGKDVSFLKQPMFFGEDLAVQRYDTMKYPIFDKLTQQQLGYFWTTRRSVFTKR